jgi:hypothetical protein
VVGKMTTSVSTLAARGGTILWKGNPPVPVEAKWNDVWLAVTPIWAVLASCRVAFYALERIRYPAVVPPVVADAVQALLLWPLDGLTCRSACRCASCGRHNFARYHAHCNC